jgi:hypothetical protein
MEYRKSDGSLLETAAAFTSHQRLLEDVRLMQRYALEHPDEAGALAVKRTDTGVPYVVPARLAARHRTRVAEARARLARALAR